MVKTFQKDRLQVRIFERGSLMADAAADFVVQHLQNAIQGKGTASLVIGTGTSQIGFYEALKNKSIDWSKIIVFHLDEYVGISPEHPASFRKYLHERIIDIVKPGKAYFLKGDAGDLRAEIQRYTKLLQAHPADISCIGIGENGHIAFNDPAVADFNDPQWVKVANLDEVCRGQQVGEGWFASLEDVPKRALTLTIPTIMRSNVISCVVPEHRKAEAVHKALYGPITTACPASVLRTHPNTTLFLDKNSASLVKDINNS